MCSLENADDTLRIVVNSCEVEKRKTALEFLDQSHFTSEKKYSIHQPETFASYFATKPFHGRRVSPAGGKECPFSAAEIHLTDTFIRKMKYWPLPWLPLSVIIKAIFPATE